MKEDQTIQAPKPKRPQLLTILCILTFIGSGISAAGFFAVSIDYETSMEILELFYADMPEAALIINAPRDFFIVSFLLSAFSVIGAILMWNLRKPGFHLYALSQIIYLVIPILYFGGDTNPMLNIIFTALFVYLYARNLPYMR